MRARPRENAIISEVIFCRAMKSRSTRRAVSDKKFVYSNRGARISSFKFSRYFSVAESHLPGNSTAHQKRLKTIVYLSRRETFRYEFISLLS